MKVLFTLFILFLPLLQAASVENNGGVINWRYYTEEGITATKNRSLRSTPSERLDGLTYLNTLRTGAGMIPYTANSLLDSAAQNHIDYLIEQNIFSHDETNSSSLLYTGYKPWDRGNAVGYPYLSYYGENLSYGDNNVYEAIDGLFTAIYHRFGFLGFLNNEIGIGSDQTIYGFNMANQNTWSNNRQINPPYVLWPHNNYKNAQTSFGNTESPDPVPECNGINGNPISIEFNTAKSGTINMTSFKLYENDGSEITDVKDPTTVGGLNPNQFVLFPIQSLDLDSRYKAEFKYTEDSTPKTITWSFNTRRYENKRYVATSGNTYDVISGETYLFHLKFDNCNTGINSWQWSGNASIEHLASDLFRITATGNTAITFKYNGTPTFTLNLNIAPTDNAIEPSSLDTSAIVPIINYLLF